jgi:hypothetical protein
VRGAWVEMISLEIRLTVLLKMLNTLIVMERNGIITAYEPSKRYLDKIRGGGILWKKN